VPGAEQVSCPLGSAFTMGPAMQAGIKHANATVAIITIVFIEMPFLHGSLGLADSVTKY
jgi:hypothetical protein